MSNYIEVGVQNHTAFIYRCFISNVFKWTVPSPLFPLKGSLIKANPEIKRCCNSMNSIFLINIMMLSNKYMWSTKWMCSMCPYGFRTLNMKPVQDLDFFIIYAQFVCPTLVAAFIKANISKLWILDMKKMIILFGHHDLYQKVFLLSLQIIEHLSFIDSLFSFWKSTLVL